MTNRESQRAWWRAHSWRADLVRRVPLRATVCAVVLMASVGCGDDDAKVELEPDAGDADLAIPDSGPPLVDTGAPEAPRDSGQPDATPMEPGRVRCDPVSETARDTNGDNIADSCVCKAGFLSNGTACIDINECTSGHADCDDAPCDNLPGAFVCRGASCPAGFVADATLGCLDLDECTSDTAFCGALGGCGNKLGGFVCTNNACPPGYESDALRGCVNVDECALGTNNCDSRMLCTDTRGSFKCSDCPAGFADTSTLMEPECSDIDECTLNTDDCDPLVTCTNTSGGFTCGACPTGYTRLPGSSACVDVDECSIDYGGCDPLSTCTNTVGGVTCGGCPSGYTRDANGRCNDVDECATNQGGCDVLTTCVNTAGAFSCGVCPFGFTGTGETGCLDIDECASNNGGCDAFTTCANVPGTFLCGDCPQGFLGGGDAVCTDIDECAQGACGALTACTNVPGGFVCGACPSGYTGSGETGCVDVNECGVNNGGCDLQTRCTNTPGSYSCSSCPPGFSGTGQTGCVDIDECATNNGGCDPRATCYNTRGGRICSSCPAGFTGTGDTSCVDIDECATNRGGCDRFATCVNEPGTSRCVEPVEDVAGLVFAPRFEPDYNTLVPQPWVELASTRQTETVTVTPTQLVFPLANNADILTWVPGRVVVSAPGSSAQTGANPLGFARRVTGVTQVGSTIVVATETVRLEDIVTGDLQHTFDYSQLNNVDLSKLDLAWAAENLYVDADALSPDFDVAPDNEPMQELDANGNPVPGSPFFGKIISAVKKGVSAVGNAIGGAASAVANVAGTVWRAVTPSSFSGSVAISREIGARYSSDLFRLSFSKTFNETGRTPMQLSLSGSGSVNVDVSFKPGIQVGMRIPNIGHNETLATWMNVDSQYRSSIALGVDLEAAITSAGTLTGSDLGKKLAEQGELAADVLTQAREKFTGNPDMKPAGGWKRTIFISNPATQVIFAGPLPVVFTQTFQVDMECGFAAKASLKAQMQFERVSNLKFSMRYEAGKVTGTLPVVETRKNRSVNITGGGTVSVSCGLIPRVNVFVYDTAGMFAGVRGSLVAEAGYQSMCEPDPLLSTPKAEVNVGLYGNVGVQVGGRLQAPGSSYAGKAGQKFGTDIGPFELWNTQFPIYEKIWQFDKGLGYCTPTCKNTVRDARETDLNCGGGACNACAETQQCVKNTDCARGFCSGGRCSNTNHCGDGVMDGDETGIDCGGATCRTCRAGVGCYLPRDCTSGACAVTPTGGSKLGYCVQNHCADQAITADETGFDCGGSTCAKCADGARSSSPAGCASGMVDGEFCVSATCRNRLLTAGESDIDCGGVSSCARCGYGQACTVNTDCSPAAPVCDPSTRLCARPLCDDGVRNIDETDVDCGGSCTDRCDVSERCLQVSDCSTGLDCDPGAQVCVAPRCDDGRKNGNETDSDCGGSCTAGCQLGKRCLNNGDCASSAPICDSNTLLCKELTCPAGQYVSGQTCVNVGIGFWSPANDRQRYSCTNAPANAGYSSATASSAQCPYSCNAGYTSSGSQCVASSSTQYLNCNSNEVAVGVNGRSGAWFDAIGVRCAPFDGTSRSGVVRSGPQVGGSGGDPFTDDCGPNEVLVGVTGINGWNPPPSWCNGTNMSTVTLSCRDLSSNVVRTLSSRGGNGSCTAPKNMYTFSCAQGQAVSGLTVDSQNTTQYVGYMLGLSCR